MGSVADYVRHWTKRERELIDTLSKSVMAVWSLIQIRIKNNEPMSTRVHKYCTQKTCLTSIASMLLSLQTYP